MIRDARLAEPASVGPVKVGIGNGRILASGPRSATRLNLDKYGQPSARPTIVVSNGPLEEAVAGFPSMAPR